MSETFIPLINTIISSVISLIVAFGTWHVSMKKDREKQMDEVKDMLMKHREEYLGGIQSVQDDLSQINATIQNQIGIIEIKIDTLSKRVDKHNNVIERTYALEQKTAVQEEQIKTLFHKVED